MVETNFICNKTHPIRLYHLFVVKSFSTLADKKKEDCHEIKTNRFAEASLVSLTCGHCGGLLNEHTCSVACSLETNMGQSMCTFVITFHFKMLNAMNKRDMIQVKQVKSKHYF